jgi:biotin carboxylase
MIRDQRGVPGVKILIVNRSSSEFCRYGRVIDHREHAVAYVTVASHRPDVPAASRYVEIVDERAAPAVIVAAARRGALALGGVDRVLTMTEIDQITVAELRAEFGAAGPSVELVRGFRDKVVMKRRLAAQGLRTPRFRAVTSVEDVAAFAAELGAPVIAKPRLGVASTGCVIVERADMASVRLAGLVLDDYEVEEFVHGPIWHVDGLLADGEPSFVRASRYIGTCYGFAHGEPLASIVERRPLADALCAFACRCTLALGMREGVFHLEAICSAEGLVFMEVAARVGGTYIPYVLRDVYGVDLADEWVRQQIGMPSRLAYGPPPPTGVGGGVVIPEAVGKRVAFRRSMLGVVPEIYRERLAPVGHIFAGNGEYDDVLGTFLLRGESVPRVEAAIGETIAGYDYHLNDVDDYAQRVLAPT